MTQRHKIQLFEDKKVRTAWDDEREIRGRFFDPFLIKGLKYPVRNKSH